MAAPVGNKFYKKRTDEGRKWLFSSPQILYEESVKYFEWCDANPWSRVDYKGRKKVLIPTARPYTLAGLCSFLGVGINYFRQFKQSLESKTGKKTAKNTKGFLLTISMIEQIIYVQKFEGAAVGAFNANIISRDLGLVDKQAHEIDFNKMTDDQLDAFINRVIKSDR